MKKAIAFALALLLLAGLALAEETASGIWLMSYYVDEFRMPTDAAYVRNAEPIAGIFSNSAATDKPAGLVILLDEQGLCLVLYEYGTNTVKNPYSQPRGYDIMLREADGTRQSLRGTMFSGGDRVNLQGNAAETLSRALRENHTLMLYIAEADNPGTNYLFTIEDTTGFAETEAALQELFNARDYKAAVALWDRGNYAGALKAFAALGDYRDSAEWDGRYRAMMYESAEGKLAEGDYAGANADFIEAGSYSDARDRVGEPFYKQAEALLAAGDADGAINAFKLAGSYSDAKARIGEIHYARAEALLEEGDYEGANEAFVNAGSYSDARDRVGEPYYKQAEALLAAGDYDGASAAFANAGDYSDAKDRVQEPYYVRAEALMAEGQYGEASEAFASLGDYRDAAGRVNEPFYVQAEARLSAGDEDGAIEAFKKAGDYSDADMRWRQIYYDRAERLLAGQDYENAAQAFFDAGDYLDAKDRVYEPYYAKGEALLSAGNELDAIDAFAIAGNGGYRDGLERAQAIHYNRAERFLAAGDIPHAAMSFGNADDIRDARARSLALWDSMQSTVTLSTGYNSTVAVKKDGSVVATGKNEYGECDVKKWKHIRSIQCDSVHTIGLTDDGHLVVVGSISEKSQSVYSGFSGVTRLLPTGSGVVGMTADHRLLLPDQFPWNVDDDGIIDLGGNKYALYFLYCNGDVVKVTSGGQEVIWQDIVKIGVSNDSIEADPTVVGLKADGSVVLAGRRESNYNKTNPYVFDVSGWTDIVAVSVGNTHILGLKADGTVVATGSNLYGQCDVSGWKNIVAISAGSFHSAGLTKDGRVVAVGYDKHGECKVSKWKNIRLPEPLAEVPAPAEAPAPAADSGEADSGEADQAAYSTLSLGSNGKDVIALQKALIQQGALSGKADGDYGRKTANAVSALQSQWGMDPTGIADDAFQRRLYGE